MAEGLFAGKRYSDTLGQGPRVSCIWPANTNRRPATNKESITATYWDRPDEAWPRSEGGQGMAAALLERKGMHCCMPWSDC